VEGGADGLGVVVEAGFGVVEVVAGLVVVVVVVRVVVDVDVGRGSEVVGSGSVGTVRLDVGSGGKAAGWPRARPVANPRPASTTKVPTALTHPITPERRIWLRTQRGWEGREGW
jgi:hypothetical protein